VQKEDPERSSIIRHRRLLLMDRKLSVDTRLVGVKTGAESFGFLVYTCSGLKIVDLSSAPKQGLQ